MGAQLWGTYAVNDHCQPGVLARGVLLFDRLVLPVPETSEERARWRHPDQSWDPDGLDRALAVLGTQQAKPNNGGASLAWKVPWTKEKWILERSRTETVRIMTSADAFDSTRDILSWQDNLPRAIEAVAAFPSARACKQELQPAAQPPHDQSAAEALIALARPLLVPKDGDLRLAAELAREGASMFVMAEKRIDWTR
ncbi:hypothetical protein [Nonomuraea sp. NPDC046570]|uniref:hypothetical protein n=1 Tax=Nonomuraea sp. NPDC046570 TaxID=3155255 RepID=UPI003404AAB9